MGGGKQSSFENFETNLSICVNSSCIVSKTYGWVSCFALHALKYLFAFIFLCTAFTWKHHLIITFYFFTTFDQFNFLWNLNETIIITLAWNIKQWPQRGGVLPKLLIYYQNCSFILQKCPFVSWNCPFFPELPFHFSIMPFCFPVHPFNFPEVPSFCLLCTSFSKNVFLSDGCTFS